MPGIPKTVSTPWSRRDRTTAWPPVMFCVVISQVPPGSRERHGQGPGHDTPSSPRRPLCPGPGACQASVSRGALAPADDRARALAARESGVASKGTRHRRMRGTGKQIDATVSLRSRHPPARAGWEASAPAGRGHHRETRSTDLTVCKPGWRWGSNGRSALFRRSRALEARNRSPFGSPRPPPGRGRIRAARRDLQVEG